MSRQYTAKLSPAERERFRVEQVAAIPSWYSPWGHLLFPSLVGLGVVAVALALVRDLRPLELLVVPIMFLVSNAAEWRIHRDLLHRRTPLVEVLYDRHTPIHHRIYVTEDMAMRSRQEFRLVLLPAYAILIFLLVVLPLAGLLWTLLGRNVSLLFLVSCVAYILSYEWLHLLYHLPADSFLGRRALVRMLRRHHATHHAPELMQRWNFNVTIPLWDLMRRTYRVDAASAAGAAAPAQQDAAPRRAG